jgi:hypothetical protein
LDVHNPTYQSLRDRIIAARFPNTAELLAFEDITTATYRDQRSARMIQTAAQLMLSVHGTRQAVADAIGIDGSCISVARHHGDLGARPLASIFAEEAVLSHILRNLHLILCEMGRAGFIAAARETYARWHGLDPAKVDLTLDRYEDLCRRLPAGLTDGSVDPRWRDVFVFVFATVEGIGAPSLWWPPRHD